MGTDSEDMREMLPEFLSVSPAKPAQLTLIAGLAR